MALAVEARAEQRAVSRRRPAVAVAPA
jgi:hypothetical protein